jgi:hypothetical protein
MPQPLARWKFFKTASGKFGLLLAALLVLILFFPLLVVNPAAVEVASLLSAAVLVAALHAAQPGPRAVAVGIALATLDFLLGRLALLSGQRHLLTLECSLWILTLLYVIAAIIETIFTAPRVTLGVIQAALCVFLLLGVTSAFALAIIELLRPGSFLSLAQTPIHWHSRHDTITSFMRFFSLSFATLSGAGGAEIQPATPFATNAASLEAMLGQIYLAVIIARLVGVEVIHEDDTHPPTTPARP